MGLYGSEYWTYSLPRRVGAALAERLTAGGAAGERPPPRCGSGWSTGSSTAARRTSPARSPGWRHDSRRFRRPRPGSPRRRRNASAHEATKPLAAYREEELARMRRTFFDPHGPVPRPAPRLRPQGTPGRHPAGRSRGGSRFGSLLAREEGPHTGSYVAYLPGDAHMDAGTPTTVDAAASSGAAATDEKPDPYPLDQRGPELRRRLGRADRRHAAEHRGDRARRAAGTARRSPSTGRSSTSSAARSAAPTPSSSGSSRASAARSTRSCWSSRARSPTSRSSRRATGAASATTRRPASPSPPASGSTGWPPRRSPSSRSAPAPPTAASTRWRATRPARWACPTTWAGTGSPRPGIPIVCVPGCPIQPDNFSETLTYLLYQAAGSAPMIPLDDKLRPTWLFGATVHEGCDRAGYYEQGQFADDVRLARSAWSSSAAGAPWSSATCPSAAG